MAILNDAPDCARCLGAGNLERCPRCNSTNIGDTGLDGCEHELIEGETFAEIDCPDCDGTGDAEVDEDEAPVDPDAVGVDDVDPWTGEALT